MKKVILFLFSAAFLIVSSLITCFAESVSLTASSDDSGKLSELLSAFSQCGIAAAVGAVSIVLIILFIIFRKKLAAKLTDSSGSKMINTFIALFSVSGIICLAFALITDGTTWTDMMHIDNSGEFLKTQFSDFLNSARVCGSEKFYLLADKFSPFGMLLYFIIAQFMPAKIILSNSLFDEIVVLGNQTCMLLYLFIVLFVIVLFYRMSRSVLRRNTFNIRDEVTAFLLIVSFPAMYCIELGNIAGISLVFAMFFIMYFNSEKKLFRELAYASLGISAAITPYTLIFALFIFDKFNKKNILRFIRTAAYFVVLFTAPAFFTGFHNMKSYIISFLALPSKDYIIGNTSITNLLTFFGIDTEFILYAVFIVTQIIAAICIFILPAFWQKAAAAVYIILNMTSMPGSFILIFAFIPFVLLLSEKKHSPVNWLYMLAFSLLIIPIPEWFCYDKYDFRNLMTMFGITNVYSANELISLPAVQMLFVLLLYQLVIFFKNNKQKKTASAVQLQEDIQE